MKKKTRFNLKILGVVLTVVGILGFVGFNQLGQNVDQDTSSIFEIPIPEELLSFAGQSNTNSNASILCSVKQTTVGVDSTGLTVATIQSKLLQGNPLLSITTTSGVKMAGYGIVGKIFCENTFNDDNLSNPSAFTFVIDNSNLNLQILTNDKDGKKITTHTASFQTSKVEIPIGSGEKPFAYLGVISSDIEDNLQDGSYASVNEFQVRGNIEVYWKGYPNAKYTIPVTFGDIPSYHSFKVEKGTSGATTFSGGDKDGDGISDVYPTGHAKAGQILDKCPDKPENYNGFEDSDGCPDVAPTQTTTTTSSTSSIVYTECLTQGKTWYMDSNFKTDPYCGTKFTTTSGACGIYDITTKSCVVLASKITLPSGCVTLSNNTKICPSDPIRTSSSGACYQKDMDQCVFQEEKKLGTVSGGITTPTIDGLSGTMLWNVVVKDADGGTFAFIPEKDDSPFKFVIPLSIVGSDSGGARKQISEITAEGLLKFSNHNLVDTKSSTVKYTVTVGIGGDANTNPTWYTVKTVSAEDFIPRNGASAEAGMSIGQVTVRASEIEGVVPASLVPIGESANMQLKINAIGNVGIVYNDKGQLKPLTVTLADTGKCSELSKNTEPCNETNFKWTGLTLNRGGGDTGNDTPQSTKEQCESDNDPQTIWNDSLQTCLSILVTIDGDQPKSPTPDASGMCNLDSGAGDSNGDGIICQICTDDASGVGGFPCDDAYRADYCNGTTKCGSAEGGDDPPSCNDVFADKDNSCTVDVGQSCPEGFVAFVKGVELQCNPIKIDGGNECPANASCAPSDGKGSTGTSTVCVNGNCESSGIDNNMLIIIGVLGVVGGIIAIIAKKRR